MTASSTIYKQACSIKRASVISPLLLCLLHLGRVEIVFTKTYNNVTPHKSMFWVVAMQSSGGSATFVSMYHVALCVVLHSLSVIS